jgi:MSHA pilin protein MshD
MPYVTRFSAQRGISLIELLVFIVVVGIAVTGVITVYSTNARASADPVVRKQVLAVAESLLEEVLGQPYTYCDPDDPTVETAASAADCAIPEAPKPEAGESRHSATQPFDNVNDYDGLAMTGITDVAGDTVTGLDAYNATVSVTPAGAFNGIPAGETLLVTVTVTGPGNHSISLSGYRTRHAPNL